MKQATICYPVRGQEVLLGMKKERFGAGKWNGFGGKVEAGEEVVTAAARELAEEAGLVAPPSTLQQAAIIDFYFAEQPIFECHVFVARHFTGEPQESDEMRPQWFPIDALPYDSMWASDPYWLPLVFAGNTLRALCRFDAEGQKVVHVEIDPGRLE